LPWCLTHPSPVLAAAGRAFRVGRRTSRFGLLRLLSPSKDRPPSGASCSALRRRGIRPLLRLLLSSAAPSRRLTTPVAHPLPGAGRQTSQGKTRDLHAIYPAHIRPHPPGDLGLRVFWPPRPDADASCASCTSGRHFAYSFLQTPPHDDALAVRLTVPITKARRGLSPPSHRPDTTPTKSRQSRRSAPCLAHQQKGRP